MVDVTEAGLSDIRSAATEGRSIATSGFCRRLLQPMGPQVRTCRLSIVETEQLPGDSNAYFEAMFATTHQRLTASLVEQYGLHSADGAALAEDLQVRAVVRLGVVG